MDQGIYIIECVEKEMRIEFTFNEIEFNSQFLFIQLSFLIQCNKPIYYYSEKDPKTAAVRTGKYPLICILTEYPW